MQGLDDERAKRREFCHARFSRPAALLRQFDNMPRPCYYASTMKTVDTFGLTYSYPWGGSAPA